ncbi:MAG: restriction endonuclease subunit S [Acidiferrobacter sp.]
MASEFEEPNYSFVYVDTNHNATIGSGFEVYAKAPYILDGMGYASNPHFSEPALALTQKTSTSFATAADAQATINSAVNGVLRTHYGTGTAGNFDYGNNVIRTDYHRYAGSFLSYAIRPERERVLQLMSGTTVFHFYGTDMKRFTFLVPDIDEQLAIVRVRALEDMNAEIAAPKMKLAKTFNVKQGMMQELLTGRIRLV